MKNGKALTLLEQAKIAMNKDNILPAVIMEIYAKNSDILQYLPIKTTKTVYDKDTEKAIFMDTDNETVCIFGGDLDVDIGAKKQHGDFTQFRSEQEVLMIKRMSQWLSKTIIKGNNKKDPRGFDGLRVRCTSRQLISNGDCVLHVHKLNKLIASVNNPTHLLMNKTIRQRLVQYDKQIDFRLDCFGRRVPLYRNLPIMIVDNDHEYNEILPFTEKDSFGIPQCTSIYCLSLSEDGVVGLQTDEMKVRDLGILSSKPVARTRIEWYVGMAVQDEEAAARLQYIKDGSIEV